MLRLQTSFGWFLIARAHRPDVWHSSLLISIVSNEQVLYAFVVPRYFFDIPNSLRPPFDRLRYELGTAEAALQEKLQMSLPMLHLMAPRSFAACTGLNGKILLSLAAKQIKDIDVGGDDDLCFLPHLTIGQPDYHCYEVIRERPGARDDVGEIFAYRLFRRGVRKHVESVAAGQPVDLRSWLCRYAFDPWTPAKMPSFYYDREGKPTIQVKNEASFSDMESFLAAVAALMELIARYQEAYGREWVRKNWQRMNDEWIEPLVERDILAAGDWQSKFRTACTCAVAAIQEDGEDDLRRWSQDAAGNSSRSLRQREPAILRALRHLTRSPSAPCHQRSAVVQRRPHQITHYRVVAAARVWVEAGREGGDEESKVKGGSQEGTMQSKTMRLRTISLYHRSLVITEMIQ